ncbi:uncharacterized protein LOC118276938 isoform X3 [Spodoptera frugiperda]|uniref:Uncharacterized protein LOC118276938 isoform X3 n=1 Tax=Spodoptera frugiperda TaxID=7108 RepID=A0A9R0EZF0_SPOFR|nr:uncharacterized protein LOC118276938 isoform X3 [Spodoptera frugiperda]
MWYLLLLLLPGVRMQDDDLSPKDHHYRLPFNAVQFVEHKSSKNGPILFPNDAPPPPPTPLIVTSRPLIESIARSELNPNNSVAAQSQFHQVQYKPDYLTRTRTYTPYTNGVSSTPVYDYRPPNVYIVTTARPEKENFYKEYEKRMMEFFQPKKNETRRRNLWEHPIYRRTTEQQSRRMNNARKANFDDDVKGKQIKVLHSSLYSREAEYNEVADHHENQEEHNMIDIDASDSLRQKRSTAEEDDSKASYFNFNKETINSKLYDNSKETQAKPLLSVKTFNQNDREIFATSTESQTKYRNRRNQPYSHEVSSQEKSSDSSLFSLNLGNKQKNRPVVKLRQVVNIQKHKSDTNQAYNDEVMARARNNMRTQTNKQSGSGEWERHGENEAMLPQRRPVYKSERDSDQYKDKEVNPPPRDDEMKELLSTEQKDKPDNFFDKIGSTTYHEKEINPQNEALKKIGRGKKPKVVRTYQFGKSKRRDQEHIPTRKMSNVKYQDQSSEHLNYGGGPGPENSKEYNHGENYAFSYTVKDHKTGDDFSHSQQSTGSATNGEYRVRLPDGRMQIVSYTADENGYNAKVRYDEHTTPDNNLDVDVTKGNVYHPPTPITYKHLDKVYTDNNKDSFENDEYIRQRYNDDKIVKSSVAAERPVFNDIAQNYYGPKQNDFQNFKPHYETTKSVNKDRADDLTDTNNEFLKHFHQKLAERNKLQRTKDEDYFKFSQEIADYSSELGLHGNKKHKAKYADFESPSEGEANGKVTPTYEELKELFASNGNRQQHVVSTARPYDDVTDNLVVEITPRKPNLYTNVNYFNNLISATPSPFPFPATATTPSSYLYSTIANLKHRLSVGHKPVLSHQYINKINKYLMYK